MNPAIVDVTEQKRLNEAREAQVPWKKWGPYLSERQWGTVREDYSQDGDAWNYFTHDQSRSRAYRWGEDGLGGLCDDKQRLCFALALWNERDPILKERLFGLTNGEGNHGEDVKEYYFYLDSTPTHSYMKYLYKYPQREFPYRDLIETNPSRSRRSSSPNCSTPACSTTIAISTCSSNTRRQVRRTCSFASPSTIAVRERRRLQVLPTLWFRNTWSWGEDERKPTLRERRPGSIQPRTTTGRVLAALRRRARSCLFTENETNASACGASRRAPYVKDAFHRLRHRDERKRVNPAQDRHQGRCPLRPRRACRWQQRTIRLRLRPRRRSTPSATSRRSSRAASPTPTSSTSCIAPDRSPTISAEYTAKRWRECSGASSIYHFDVERWLSEHDEPPLIESARHDVRNTEWFHMLNADD